MAKSISSLLKSVSLSNQKCALLYWAAHFLFEISIVPRFFFNTHTFFLSFVERFKPNLLCSVSIRKLVGTAIRTTERNVYVGAADMWSTKARKLSMALSVN